MESLKTKGRWRGLRGEDSENENENERKGRDKNRDGVQEPRTGAVACVYGPPFFFFFL